MTKVAKLFSILFLATITLSTAQDISITCNFEFNDNKWTRHLNPLTLTEYVCDVQTNFGTEQRNIISANGTHLKLALISQTNANVDIVKIINREIYKFPTGIYTDATNGVFLNFKGILIENSSISTITKADLQAFGTNLIYFGLRNSKVQFIYKTTFEANTAVKIIDLEGNKITFIETDTFNVNAASLFNGLRLKGVCGVTDNSIFTSLQSITTALASCASASQQTLLDELASKLALCEGIRSNLEEKISDLDKEIDVLNPTNDSCRFKLLPDEGYSCVGNKILINLAADQQIFWNGSHINGSANVDVKAVVIRSQVVKFMPLRIGESFQNLTTLIIDNSTLSVLKKGDFKVLENLLKVSLINNEITSIESGTFVDLLKLIHLDLSGNKLTQLKSDILPSTVTAGFKFYAKLNRLTMVDVIFVWRLKSAAVIDLSGSQCDFLFDASVAGSNNFANFYSNIMGSC